MATTDEILDAARELGELIAEHPAAKRLEEIAAELGNDRDAQRLLADNQRLIETLVQKQQQGQAIEPAEKQKLEQLQNSLAMHPTLRSLQVAQMELADLMRRVDEAMEGATPDAPEAASPAPGPSIIQ